MKNFVAMMLLAILMVGCNSKVKCEDEIRQFNHLSLELMSECASQFGNIYDDIEYKAQQAVIDSINSKIIPLYDNLLKNRVDNNEYFSLVKEMRQAEIDMMSSLEMIKINDEIRDLESRNKHGDNYSDAQNKFIKATKELSLILPSDNEGK